MLHSIVQITSIHFLPTFILINLKTESAINSTPVINSKQWPIQYIFKSLFSQNLSCLLVLLSLSDFLCIFQTLYRLLCLLGLFQNEPNIELVFSHKTLLQSSDLKFQCNSSFPHNDAVPLSLGVFTCLKV